jgi:hypothetical protein
MSKSEHISIKSHFSTSRMAVKKNICKSNNKTRTMQHHLVHELAFLETFALWESSGIM